MGIVNLDQLKESLDTFVSGLTFSMVEVQLKTEMGVVVRIDGEHCLTLISIWPNDCCDVDYFFVKSEQGKFHNFEFQSQKEAAEVVSKEIQLAVERSNQVTANK